MFFVPGFPTGWFVTLAVFFFLRLPFSCLKKTKQVTKTKQTQTGCAALGWKPPTRVFSFDILFDLGLEGPPRCVLTSKPWPFDGGRLGAELVELSFSHVLAVGQE